MWKDSIRQEEGGAQVALELRFFLDEGKELSINSLLVLFPLLRHLVLLQMETKTSEHGIIKMILQLLVFKTISKLAHLLLCIKDLSLLVTGSPQLLLLEVGIIQRFWDLHARDVNFCFCSN